MDWIIGILVSLALSVVAQLLVPRPKRGQTRPAGLGDFNFPTAEEGRLQPIVFGTVLCTAPNVVWYGDLQQVPVTDSFRYSLFGETSVIVGYKYSVGFHASLCRGPIDAIVAIYWGEKKVWELGTDQPPNGDEIKTITIDKPILFGGNDLGNGGIGGEVDILPGGEDQPIDPYLAQFQQTAAGTDRTTAYPGDAGLVFKSFYVGNTPSIQPLAVEVRRIPNGLELPPEQAFMNGTGSGGSDCNPMNVMYEAITARTEWSMRQSPASVDVESFRAAAAVLAEERNGFSALIDTRTTIDELRLDLERQIDGHIFISPTTGLWTVKLKRADYLLEDLPILEFEGALLDVEKYVAQTYADTRNQVDLTYFDRQKNYRSTPARAQDLGNAQMRGGQSFGDVMTASVGQNYPGVKDAGLANQIVWRDLRRVCRPRIGATLIANRRFSDVKLGDVIRWRDQDRGIDLPMRIEAIDYGKTEDRRIRLEVMDDMAATYPASGGAPPPTLWINPTAGVVPYAHYWAMMCPFGIAARFGGYHGGFLEKFWVGTVGIQGSLGFTLSILGGQVYYDEVRTTQQSANAQLKADLLQGATYLGELIVTCASITQKKSIMFSYQVSNGMSDDELGNSLSTLIMIEDEFLVFQLIADGPGNDILLTGVYRAVLDSVQPRVHREGVDVFFAAPTMLPGGHVSDTQPGGDPDDLISVDYGVAMTPFSAFVDGLDLFGRTFIDVANNFRGHRPTPPGQLTFNGAADATIASLEGVGAGDTFGVGVAMIRRDNRNPIRGISEIAQLFTDAAGYNSDADGFPYFPGANNTQYVASIYADPLGANTFLFAMASSSSATFTVLRDEILKATDGVVPNQIAVSIVVSHDTNDGGTFHSMFPLVWVLDITSALSALFVMGARNANVATNVYQASVAGTYAFSIFTAASGNIEVSVNGGSFTTLIAAGATSANLGGINASDTITIRHQLTTVGQQRLLSMNAPGAGQDAFALLYKA